MRPETWCPGTAPGHGTCVIPRHEGSRRGSPSPWCEDDEIPRRRARNDTVLCRSALAHRGLTVLLADVDVDVDMGASTRGPGQPGLTVHASVAGKADDERRDGGRDPDHDRGDRRNDDR